MIELPAPVFWLLLAMAAVGFLSVMLRFLRRSRAPVDDPRTEIPSQLGPPHAAPPGYRWVMVPDNN